MSNPKSTVSIGGHPIHVMLVPFVIAFYTATLVADVVYGQTGDAFWARGAFWLLTGGVGASVVAATAGLLDFLLEPRIRAISAAWWHFGGNALMSTISVVDLYLRWRSGAQAGSHDYIWLSGLAFALLLVNGWLGGRLVYEHRVGVADGPTIS